MRKLLITAMVLAPVLAIAQNNTYTLKGIFKSGAVTGKVYINYYQEGVTKRDSALVKNGSFEFKGALDGPQQIYLTYISNDAAANKKRRARDARSMYLDKGIILMDITDSVKTAMLSGKINADYKAYSQILLTTETEASKLKKQYYQLDEILRNGEAGKDLEAKIEEAKQQQKELLTGYADKNPGSYFSIQALEKIAGPYFDVAKVEPLFKKLNPELQASHEGKSLAATIKASKETALEQSAPDFTHQDTNGKPVNLSDFKGKYVLLDFWASWCGPCRAENPNVLKAYNAYKDKNFTVLGVSIDLASDRDKWLKAITDDRLPWHQLNDADKTDKGASHLYAIKAIPSNFLVDPSGKIIAKNLRGAALEKKLQEVIH